MKQYVLITNKDGYAIPNGIKIKKQKTITISEKEIKPFYKSFVLIDVFGHVFNCHNDNKFIINYDYINGINNLFELPNRYSNIHGGFSDLKFFYVEILDKPLIDEYNCLIHSNKIKVIEEIDFLKMIENLLEEGNEHILLEDIVLEYYSKYISQFDESFIDKVIEIIKEYNIRDIYFTKIFDRRLYEHLRPLIKQEYLYKLNLSDEKFYNCFKKDNRISIFEMLSRNKIQNPSGKFKNFDEIVEFVAINDLFLDKLFINKYLPEYKDKIIFNEKKIFKQVLDYTFELYRYGEENTLCYKFIVEHKYMLFEEDTILYIKSEFGELFYYLLLLEYCDKSEIEEIISDIERMFLSKDVIFNEKDKLISKKFIEKMIDVVEDKLKYKIEFTDDIKSFLRKVIRIFHVIYERNLIEKRSFYSSFTDIYYKNYVFEKHNLLDIVFNNEIPDYDFYKIFDMYFKSKDCQYVIEDIPVKYLKEIKRSMVSLRLSEKYIEKLSDNDKAMILYLFEYNEYSSFISAKKVKDIKFVSNIYESIGKIEDYKYFTENYFMMREMLVDEIHINKMLNEFYDDIYKFPELRNKLRDLLFKEIIMCSIDKNYIGRNKYLKML